MGLEAGVDEAGRWAHAGRRGARQWRLLRMLLGLLLVLGPLALAPSSSAQTAAAASPGPVWLDAAGAPLPFENDDALLEFLRTATVVERKSTDEGINRPDKLLLEADGTRVHAVFREVSVEKKRTRVQGRYFNRFVDNYALDCAAYDLARSIGFEKVPPVVLRRLGQTPGSVQLWVENAREEAAKDYRPRSPIGWVKQQWDMNLFDNLILNVDRNENNMVVGQDGELWLIDHGRAFQPQAQLLAPEHLKKINRQLWDHLQGLSDDQLKDAVREHLDTEQLEALVQRRELLVELVQGLVDEHGEGQVFY